jgi:signal transduction protein with GAF and PtsI domain
MTTTDMSVHERRPDVEELTSRLAADADDCAAQLAFAIESIADEVGQLMRELAALRTAVNEQRVLLDELRALQR